MDKDFLKGIQQDQTVGINHECSLVPGSSSECKARICEGAYKKLMSILKDVPQLLSVALCLEHIWKEYQASLGLLHTQMEDSIRDAREALKSLRLEYEKEKNNLNAKWHEKNASEPREELDGDVRRVSIMRDVSDNQWDSSSCSNDEDQDGDPDAKDRENTKDKIENLKKATEWLGIELDSTRRQLESATSQIESMGRSQASLTPRPQVRHLHIKNMFHDDFDSLLCNYEESNISSVEETEDYLLGQYEGSMVGGKQGNENTEDKACASSSYLKDVAKHLFVSVHGSTSEKFEALEDKCAALQHERFLLMKQIQRYQAQEELREQARKKYDEESQSDRKNSIQSYLEMLRDTGENAWKDKLIGMGAGLDVPKLFRLTGKIRNKHMSKRDTERLVHEVWRERLHSQVISTNKDNDLVDFLGQHLQKKMGIAAAVVEVKEQKKENSHQCYYHDMFFFLFVQLGYNFLFSLWKYQWDADCELFLKVLTGELHEEVYLAQINLQKDLEDLFYSLDKAKGVQNGIIPKVGDGNLCAYEQDKCDLT